MTTNSPCVGSPTAATSPGRRLRSPRLLLAGLALPLALLGGAQFELPRLAEERLRGRLAQYGPVSKAEVEALPAFKLLLGQADRVEIRMPSAQVAGRQAGRLEELARVGQLDASVGEVQAGPLNLEDVHLLKRGERVYGEASLAPDGLSFGLEGTLIVKLEAGPDGELLLVPERGEGRLAVRVIAEGGAIVAQPVILGLPIGRGWPVFSTERLAIDSLIARREGDRVALSAGGHVAS